MVNVTLWPDTWARFRGVVRRHALLYIEGQLERESDVVNVIADDVKSLVGSRSARRWTHRPRGRSPHGPRRHAPRRLARLLQRRQVVGLVSVAAAFVVVVVAAVRACFLAARS